MALHGLVDIFVFEINASRKILQIIRHGIPLPGHRPESLCANGCVAYWDKIIIHSRLFYLNFLILWSEIHCLKKNLRKLNFGFKVYLWMEEYHG